MRNAEGGAARERNSTVKVLRRGRTIALQKTDSVPHAEVIFQDALQGQHSTRSAPPQDSFKLVDLSDQKNKHYWVKRWNVTDIQLKIAVSRVGTEPFSVKQELFGS
jgi:hypothetical protein